MARRSSLVRPRPLGEGDRIALIAPGSSFSKTFFRRSVKWLEKRGYEVVFRQDIFEKSDYLAGEDNRRIEEWREAWEDPSIKAIFCVRGGYGALRLLERAGSDLLPNSAKIFMGYSDVTVFLNFIASKKRFPTVHGPLMAGESFLDLAEKTRSRNFGRFESVANQVLSAPKDFFVYSRKSFRGPLWGGNLAMMASMMGTPFAPDTEGGVLFLEEVNEPRYRIDRMFAQLSLAGALKNIKGVILGDFTDEKKRKHHPEFIEGLLERYLNTKKVGILTDMKAGHRHQNVWLPIGGTVEFDHFKKNLDISPFVLSS